MKIKIYFLPVALSTIAMVSGCANVTTGKQYSGFEGKSEKICVINNRKTKLNQFRNAMIHSLTKRGIAYSIVDKASDCHDTPYSLEYVARRSWDLTTYLGSVELRLMKNGKLVSQANYKAGSMTLTKWGSTEERIDGAFAKLLGEN